MSTTNPADGGPAFPTLMKVDSLAVAEGGMSLRDHFAGLAMQGIVGSISTEHEYQRIRLHAKYQGLKVSEWIARDAFKQADAMLRARQATMGQEGGPA